MTRRVHAIADVTLNALSRAASGALHVDAVGQDSLRSALEAAAAGGELRAAVLAVIEVAYVLERDMDAPGAAAALRRLAAEFTAPLDAENDGRREVKRHKIERFSRFSGAPRAPRAMPAAPPRGGLRVTDLAPPRPIMAR